MFASAHLLQLEMPLALNERTRNRTLPQAEGTPRRPWLLSTAVMFWPTEIVATRAHPPDPRAAVSIVKPSSLFELSVQFTVAKGGVELLSTLTLHLLGAAG